VLQAAWVTLEWMAGTVVRAALVTALALTSVSGSAQNRDGVLVLRVEASGQLAKAGLGVGDVLVSWRRAATPPAYPAAAHGVFSSPFEVRRVDVEERLRGAVTLVAMRCRELVEVPLPPSGSGLDPGMLAVAGAPAVTGASASAASADLALRASRERARGEPVLAAWHVFQHATQRIEDSQPEAALPLVDEALRDLGMGRDPTLVALAAAHIGEVFAQRLQPDRAITYHLRALRLLAGWSAPGPQTAASVNRLGTVSVQIARLDAGDRILRRALEIHDRVSAHSPDVAGIVNNLGLLAWMRGDLDGGDRRLRAALAVRNRLDPDSLVVAATHNNIGLLAWERGDLSRAEQHLRRDIEISERLDPGRPDLATTLNNLGIVAAERGDLAAAESYHQRALAIRERFFPGSADVAMSLGNLGSLALARGDLAAAESYLRRDLAMSRQIAEASDAVGACLGNLGIIALERDDLAEAEECFRQDLEIRNQISPNSLKVADVLDNLADVALERGDLQLAEDHIHRSLAMTERIAPDSLAVALRLARVCQLCMARQDYGCAEQTARRALAIRQRLAPGSRWVAESQHDLGVVLRRTGRVEEAVTAVGSALDTLDEQLLRLGGTERARSGFRAMYMDFYREYLDLLVATGRLDEAFRTLERSRAGEFLRTLAEREVVFAADIPEDLDRKRRVVRVSYERALEELQVLSPEVERQELEALADRLATLRQEMAEIRESIRTHNPRLHALQYPEPLDTAAAAAALDQGTLLLAYDVGAERTVLFTLERGAAVQVTEIAVGEAELRAQVESLRLAIGRAPFGLGAEGVRAVQERGTQLYQLLVAPAGRALDRAERLLFVLDGPLHLLPLAALGLPGEGGGAGARRGQHYLVESWPLHLVASATVYDQLRRGREGRTRLAEARLVAFGDPLYELVDSSVELAEAPADALQGRLQALPWSRTEVLALAAVWGDRASVALGAEATEERVKLATDARVLHIAAHGLIEPIAPLDSAIALTPPAPGCTSCDNGLLQAWEILEQVRLDADLVSLSACRTALGEELAGEGMVGLTRAFQYAGARTVLASLWSVADASTAELMARFYAHLKAGQSKDEALRDAQVELLTGPIRSLGSAEPLELDASHPFHWAAFELFGDRL